MIRHLSHPPGLPAPTRMSHVVVADGGTTVYIAGQTAFDEEHRLVGRGDVHAQTVQAYRNLRTALAAAGATFADVVKSTIYVVGVTPEVLADFMRGMDDALGEPMPPTASTFIGVAALAYPDLLVEIDAIAVVAASEQDER
jgi:2-iminobutanoate/2-iminopropanoate deaminase